MKGILISIIYISISIFSLVYASGCDYIIRDGDVYFYCHSAGMTADKGTLLDKLDGEQSVQSTFQGIKNIELKELKSTYLLVKDEKNVYIQGKEYNGIDKKNILLHNSPDSWRSIDHAKSSYKNETSIKYQQPLGRIILEVAGIILAIMLRIIYSRRNKKQNSK